MLITEKYISLLIGRSDLDIILITVALSSNYRNSKNIFSIDDYNIGNFKIHSEIENL